GRSGKRFRNEEQKPDDFIGIYVLKNRLKVETELGKIVTIEKKRALLNILSIILLYLCNIKSIFYGKTNNKGNYSRASARN
ncbi:hypothetical protein, partial [Bacteroides acidifaciens]|uniref:hypothetical protein n=1 Tax=Bacteroides acidifaciens TaxID=85831 RepID=UPI00263AEABB